MAEQEKCDSAKKYRCPYVGKKCRSRWSNIGSEDSSYLTDPDYLYLLSKRLSKGSKIWFIQKPNNIIKMYVCKPVSAKKESTFYELEKKELISKLKKEFLIQTNNLKNTIKDIEKKLK